jgi:superfamily II DNA or RNA helicase/diadenosine tetraphosphate (Ap4A) HIT family hydrolase/SOS-response transcriptional repressor LexA
MTSPFLTIPESAWVAANDLSFAIRDKFPVSTGHTLFIPKRLIATWFEATPEEQQALFALVEEVKRELDASNPKPDGYNIGINVGDAAGQTVHHLHVHLIPRYRGDVEDPRGGIRHVIPGKGNYLASRPAPLVTGGREDPFLAHILPLVAEAEDIGIISAFVQESGLSVLRDSLWSAMQRETQERRAKVRLITGDYLGITQVTALEQLLDWMASSGEAFEARIVETARLPPGSTSFHPKSWVFAALSFGTAFVGSSNVSRSALGAGIEWNYRVERHRDPEGWQRITSAFEQWWQKARPFDASWVAEYARRVDAAVKSGVALPLPPGEEDADEIPPTPQPHDIQQSALKALSDDRAAGRKRACVVLATGLGKTLLAAFDVAAWAQTKGRLPRVLLLAHREELLQQAANTFRRVLRSSWPGLRIGWCVGSQEDFSGDVVVASVQKVSQPDMLDRLAHERFDYVIVDEVHHAAAPSYRRILSKLDPQFLLGLTATPERADGGDVLGLFDDNVAFRADLGEGIHRNLLVPFAYFGLKDDIDYANIPWRNQRFDPAELARAVETEQRMERLWAAWNEHKGRRTLVFCCSVTHAEFAAKWLKARGVRAEAVHSGATSYPRETALSELRDGRLDALCTVDLFNEGVDLPEIDRVVMLRPTESPVIFLQQLGRGLRKADGKAELTVIDFVGNDRIFLERVRTLLTLASRARSHEPVRRWLESGRAELPEGCRVEVELEAKNLLKHFIPSNGSEIERVFDELFAARGTRPTIGELFRMGLSPRALRMKTQVGWFEFLASKSALTPEERQVLDIARDWLDSFEKTQRQKSFKLVTVQSLIEADRLLQGMPVVELAARSHDLLVRSPELFSDIENVAEVKNPRNPNPGAWLTYWKDNPINAWTRESSLFKLTDGTFTPRIRVPESLHEAFTNMTAELVDYRLAEYRASKRSLANADSQRSDSATSEFVFEGKVILSGKKPIIIFSGKESRPIGETLVELPNGKRWLFRFVKVACNVAHPVGSATNELPDLLRSWFGPAAGQKSTTFYVRFTQLNGEWNVAPVQPVGAQIIPFPSRSRIVAYPDLRAAAGAAKNGTTPDALTAEEIALPHSVKNVDGLFAVRASGDSMDGGEKPIRDGDWLIMRYARGASAASLLNRVVLVETPDEQDGFRYQLKRLVKTDTGWRLQSDNPARPSFEANETTTPIAVLADIISPEKVAPAIGTKLSEESFREIFNVAAGPRTGRINGHLFIEIDDRSLPSNHRLNAPELDRRPGETAFVLSRGLNDWTYLGFARWSEAEGAWLLEK